MPLHILHDVVGYGMYGYAMHGAIPRGWVRHGLVCHSWANSCMVLQYEELVAQQPLNYDNWFDYIKMEEAVSSEEVVRSVYERAVAQLPPSNQKLLWCRYIYLWINYAIFEELHAGDAGRAREVYRACLKIIPHSEFTFAKIWILAAQLEVRLWKF
jgi:hypothetical protein